MKKNKKITIITIIVIALFLLVIIATINGENSIISKINKSKKKQLESEMKEQITIGIQKLQVEKKENATLDDITQNWINEEILNEYNPKIKEDASLNGKLIIMTKDNIIGKFLIDQNLNIETIEYNTSSLDFEYTTISRTDNKVKINILVTDKTNGITQIKYPDEDILKVVNGKREQISTDYEVELGQEYKFIIVTGDGQETEKIIKIDNYYYNIIKNFGEGTIIDNNATKAAYDNTYEANIKAKNGYKIDKISVKMNGQNITTSGNNIVDIDTGKIKIEKVTGNIEIIVESSIDFDSIYSEINIEKSTNEWTNQDIIVNIDFGFDGENATKEISIDSGKNFETYYDNISISNNTTIVARINIGSNKIEKRFNITNIDKLQPNEFEPVLSDTISANKLLIIANVKDANATAENGSSGIKEYKYYIYNEDNSLLDSTTDTSNQWIVSGVNVGSTYKVIIEAFDNAGNCRKSSEASIEKKEVYSWSVYNLIKNGYYKKVKTGSGRITNTVRGYRSSSEPSFNTKTGQWKFGFSSGEIYSGYWFSSSQITDTITYCSFRTSTHLSVDYYKSKFVGTYEKGEDLLKTVTSNSENAYPENNYQGNYWYVKNSN